MYIYKKKKKTRNIAFVKYNENKKKTNCEKDIK